LVYIKGTQFQISSVPPVFISQGGTTVNEINYYNISLSIKKAVNHAPVITGIMGPSTLNTNQTGIWTVSAYDPENGLLSLTVVWGDEPAKKKGNAAKAMNASFSHIYYDPGTYIVQFTVTDGQGAFATANASVAVVVGEKNLCPPTPIADIDCTASTTAVSDQTAISNTKQAAASNKKAVSASTAATDSAPPTPPSDSKEYTDTNGCRHVCKASACPVSGITVNSACTNGQTWYDFNGCLNRCVIPAKAETGTAGSNTGTKTGTGSSEGSRSGTSSETGVGSSEGSKGAPAWSADMANSMVGMDNDTYAKIMNILGVYIQKYKQ